MISGAIRGDSTMGVALLTVTNVTGVLISRLSCVVEFVVHEVVRRALDDTEEQNLELRTYRPKSAGLPVKRSIRFAVGGWVENRLPKLIPPMNGWMMKRCAVDGLAISGRCLE
jgi:hypothetical protein